VSLSPGSFDETARESPRNRALPRLESPNITALAACRNPVVPVSAKTKEKGLWLLRCPAAFFPGF